MKKIIIFGNGQSANLSFFYITTDTKYEVEAFTVHKKYKTTEKYNNKPLVEFEDIELNYSPKDYMLFVLINKQDMNISRNNVFNEGKKKGCGGRGSMEK